MVVLTSIDFVIFVSSLEEFIPFLFCCLFGLFALFLKLSFCLFLLKFFSIFFPLDFFEIISIILGKIRFQVLGLTLIDLSYKILVLFNMNSHHLLSRLETDRSSFHALGFKEVSGKGVVYADGGFFAALDTVGFGQLCTLSNKLF